MHNYRKKRVILGVIQQIMALILAAIFGMLMLNSVIVVNNMYNEKVKYSISPFDTAGDYTNSAIFNQLFQNAINDIETSAVIKAQLETGGVVDLTKRVNVSDFIEQEIREGLRTPCPVSAEYELEKLIKWGKYGIEMQTVNFQSKFDFLTYFGYQNLINTIEITKSYEKYGIVPLGPEKLMEVDKLFDDRELEDDSDFDELEEIVAFEKMGKYIQLIGGEDALYQAIVKQLSDMEIPVTEFDRGGQRIIQVSMLDNRYEMTNGQVFRNNCHNWEEYFLLEQNVIDAIEKIGNNYTQYQKQNDNYASEKTNVGFFLQMVGIDGKKQNYTNMPEEFARLYDEEKIRYIEKKGKYLYYSPKNMEFKTNTEITEKEMNLRQNELNYALSEEMRLWICVDIGFPVDSDVFALAKEAYDDVIRNVWPILMVTSICIIGYILIWLVISCYTGKTQEEGTYLYILDRIPVELLIAVTVMVTVVMSGGFELLMEKLEEMSFRQYEYRQLMQVRLTKRYLQLVITVGGFGISTFYCMVWYSILRRCRAGFFWNGSGLQKITHGIVRVIEKMFQGRNALIQTLMPYNIFVLYNIWSILWLHKEREAGGIAYYLMIALMVLIDVSVGWRMFIRSLERYIILEGAEKIGQGDITYEIDLTELHGENILMGEAINHMGEGIRKSVAQNLKDERMKTDLITNVSHDIKTPLTSIINYVNLLKRENIITNPAKEYIQILDVKSQRLKQLTDDLVEASKISSGNIILHMERIDLTELVRQSLAEFTEKFETRNLTTVFEVEGENTVILADSRRMWRVVENLLNNVSKYAMPNTRVYLKVIEEERNIRLEIKNVSENPLNFKPEELTERFIRGDVSRSSEGSGLGLSIVKGLVEAQKGEFILELDGDLFKIGIRFEKIIEKEETV